MYNVYDQDENCFIRIIYVLQTVLYHQYIADSYGFVLITRQNQAHKYPLNIMSKCVRIGKKTVSNSSL